MSLPSSSTSEVTVIYIHTALEYTEGLLHFFFHSLCPFTMQIREKVFLQPVYYQAKLCLDAEIDNTITI